MGKIVQATICCFLLLVIGFSVSTESARASEVNVKNKTAIVGGKGIAVTASGSARVIINQTIQEEDPAVWEKLNNLQNQNASLQSTNLTLQSELNKLREEAALRIVLGAKGPNADAAVKKARDELAEGRTIAAENYLKFLEQKMLAGAKGQLADAAKLARERASLASWRDNVAAESAAHNAVEYEADNPKNWIMLGDVFYNQVKFGAASEAYSKAQELAERCLIAESKNNECIMDLITTYDKQVSIRHARSEVADKLLEYYRKSAVLIKQVLSRDPDNPTWMFQLAKVYLEMGEVSIADTGAGDSDLFDNSFEIMSKLVLLDADNMEWQFLFAEVHNRRGRVKKINGDFEGALRDYHKGLEIYQKLKLPSLKIGFALNIAEIYKNIGNIYSARGQLNEGLVNYEKSIKVVQEALAAYKESFPLLVNLSNYYRKIAITYVQMGDNSSGLINFRNAADVLEGAIEKYPEFESLVLNLSICYEDIGKLHVDGIDLTEGINALQKSLSLLKKFESDNQDVNEGKLNQSSVLMAIGAAQMKQGKHKESLLSLNASIEIITKAVASLPNKKDWAYNQAKCHLHIALSYKELSNFQEAKTNINSALKIIGVYNKVQTDDTEWNLLYFEALYLLGDLQAAEGSLLEAVESYEKGLSVIKKISSGGEDNSQWRFQLAEVLIAIGDVYRARRDFARAISPYAEALESTQRLVKTRKDNVDYVLELSGVYGRLGEVQQALGDYPAALYNFEQSQAVVVSGERLKLKQNQFKLTKLKTFLGIADIHSNKLLHEEAIAYYKKAIAVVESLENINPPVVDTTALYVEIHNRLGNEYKAVGYYKLAIASYTNCLAMLQKLFNQNGQDIQLELAIAAMYYNIASLAPEGISINDASENYYKAREALLRVMLKGGTATGYNELTGVVNAIGCKLERLSKKNMQCVQ
ncbi:tetratricopeptide repeat protein [Geomonas ferrireducens]|uniref:tetratricopeptide repeat protein n=1 Tax=Geomonas ferrireducens TaxID=2570227 RepID=UPI0013A5DE77|nr:hypothetical protein [Geomonas ferrireducens]